ncbi:hypothetical protein L1987_06479 [Smallanthus sonchifolius]|uniref:Uncharacterized protein n=1 Tax=Smallanthus sonchifolius TaxID=185202 RepID=A0ACB9JYM1_9ASTR|nr:hypothetical protein L1987_06479 [Smallanthus sonchifolius]
MNLDYKHPHNALPFSEKNADYQEFHPIIDFLQRCAISYALTVNRKLYDILIRELCENASFAYLEKKNTILTTIDGQPKVFIEKNQLDYNWRAAQQVLVKPTRRSKSVTFPLPVIGSSQASQSHQSKSQHLADTSKGKKHIIGAPSKKVASLGTGDTPNHIVKKLLSKATYKVRNIFKETLKKKVETLDRQVPKRVRVESDQHSVGKHQAPLVTEISKPLPTYVEPIFTSVATESSTAATEPLNQEKAKGKMPMIEEEETEKTQGDVSEHISTDPHNIILGTNM